MTIGFPVLPALPAQAAPQKSKPESEQYLPVHAVLMIHGWAIPAEGCSRHGINIVWEGDLEECDDDPEGIYPCASYTGSGPFATLQFDDWVCKQEGRDDVRFTHKYNSEATGSADLILVDQMDDGSFDRSIRFVFHGFDLGYELCSDGTGPGSLSIDLSWTADFLTPPLSFTEEDIERGFMRTHRTTQGIMDVNEEEWTPEIQASSWGDDYELEATLTLSYKRDTKKPKVEIAGCAHLLPGGSEQLTATGTPSGGKYKWSAEPASVLEVSGSESSASAKAGKTGRATVRVEYEARNGKKAEATLPGSVVTLTSVNGGAAIPTVYLLDEYGKERPPIEVPTAQDPPDGDLLNFVVSSPGIATVANLGSKILIQGKHEGSTYAQPTTKCGKETGPLIPIKVAACDPEMVAKLKARYREAKQQLDESVRRGTRATGSDKFTEASNEIKGDVVNVAVQAVDVAAVGASGFASATHAVHTAEKVIAGGTAAWDAHHSGVEATLIKTAVIALLPVGGVSLVIGYEKIHAVTRLVEHTKTLLDTNEKVSREQVVQNGLSQELEHIDDLIDKCKRASEGGPPEPKAPPLKPGPTPPKPGPTPPKDKPGGDKPAPGEPTPPTRPGEPESGEGKTPPSEPPVVEPPTPPKPPGGGGTAGIPIDCGCPKASSTAWRNEDTGLAAIAASLSLLQGCAENYADELEQFRADSSSIAGAVRAVEGALEIPGEKGFEQFRAALSGLSAAATTFERLSKAAEEFRSTLDGCDKKLPEAVELIKKAAKGPEMTAPGTKP